MTAEAVGAARPTTRSSEPGIGPVRRLLVTVGGPAVIGLRWMISNVALGTTVVVLALRPSTWRRTVIAEFRRALRESTIGVLPATCVMAVLVGFGLLYQALHWLEQAGQITLLGRIIVVVLMRELAPVLVALIIIGRSGTATLLQLTQMRDGGQLRMLDSQGVDPFLLLVLPRTLAYTVACFTLTILFIAITMVAGYLFASLVGAVQISFLGFIDAALQAKLRGEFLLIPVKSLALGFAVGVVCCHTALTHRREATRVVATGFVRSALVVLAVSGLLSLVL